MQIKDIGNTTEIMNKLTKIEGIRILYVCESGSRAYGLYNQESDYDVRFIYALPVNSYLNIFNQKEEITIRDEQYDIVGWDIKKVLRLLSKNNPSLYEWLNSPVIYYEDASFNAIRQLLLKKGFSLRSLALHYISMARSNYKKIMNYETAGVKSCLMVLRPLLMGKWILDKKELPPIYYPDLIELETSIHRKLEKLIVLRKNNIQVVPFTNDIESFINREMDLGMKKIVQLNEQQTFSEDELNALFIEMVQNKQWHLINEQEPKIGTDIVLMMKLNQKNQYFYAKAYVLGDRRYTINGKVFVTGIITNKYEPMAWIEIEKPSNYIMSQIFKESQS
ncbi:nucleotidyltransferase domain-containing protein [Floccifex sp.]|uniref:nucleotidyltransferase domain-containing protein n=1 Tax=Floccifex sp. TaxID=2815810 RepID=UPI002A754921|nr:nucleotidyltransferase domain-containing protein [Floccifex sp.]MDY2958871.1 nucleotidyltransferase domain-containing protein [Floccifex sp.]